MTMCILLRLVNGKKLLDNSNSLFVVKQGPKFTNTHNDPDRLYAKIGQLNMELDWLKIVWTKSIEERQSWIAINENARLGPL